MRKTSLEKGKSVISEHPLGATLVTLAIVGIVAIMVFGAFDLVVHSTVGGTLIACSCLTLLITFLAVIVYDAVYNRRIVHDGTLLFLLVVSGVSLFVLIGYLVGGIKVEDISMLRTAVAWVGGVGGFLAVMLVALVGI